jgi:aspartyl/glutamyl-tRNA(Asn/Gln) amidotransferase C subunit
VDRNTLDALCQLARLRLDDAETDAFAEKFNGLLSFVERICKYEPNSADTALSSGAQLMLRKDKPQSFGWSPTTQHDYRVPAVINFEGEA